ncbi:glutamyl-tRNA synthetase [gamma proteobacterium HTCC5015]|nr:glutamyl-tRNA synthetase [gamma proteobacterium HTCC5015]
MNHPNAHYRGRFAPSPTGPLHFGSLVAALASYLDAHANHGEWHVRMEDLDPPRCEAGAADAILQILDSYGFEWDGPVLYQSQRGTHYKQALQTLDELGLTYPCDCTRKEIHARCAMGEYGPIYDGHCRQHAACADTTSLRLKVKGDIAFEDGLQGLYQQNLSRDIGDFHLRRRDGLFAYHLGVVVDDAEQGFTHIVRGYDLLDSTPRQIYLQHCLGFAVHQYSHLPLVLKNNGQKFSKQNRSPALRAEDAVDNVWLALQFLGQSPAPELRKATLKTLWEWATDNWQLSKVPRVWGTQLDEAQ